VFDPQVRITYAVDRVSGNSAYLLGLSLDYGAMTAVNVSMPFTSSRDATSNSLAVCFAFGEGERPDLTRCAALLFRCGSVPSCMQLRPSQDTQPPFESGFLAVLTYAQVSVTLHRPSVRYLNPSTGELMHKAARRFKGAPK